MLYPLFQRDVAEEELLVVVEFEANPRYVHPLTAQAVFTDPYELEEVPPEWEPVP